MRNNDKTVPLFGDREHDNILVTPDNRNLEFVYYDAYKFNNTYIKETPEDGSPIITGNQGIILKAEYRDNRIKAILDKPSQYKVAIKSFQLPISSIPLFRIINNENTGTQLNPIYPYRNTITFRFTYNNNTVSEVSAYLFQNDVDREGTYVFELEEFLEKFNELMVPLFNDLKLAYFNKTGNNWSANTDLPQEAPFLRYLNIESMFYMYADARINNVSPLLVPGRMEVIFSNNLKNLLSGLNYKYTNKPGGPRILNFYEEPGNANLESINYPNPNSPTLYVVNKQSLGGVPSLYTFKKLYILSASIGIRSVNIGIDDYFGRINGVSNLGNIIGSYFLNIDSDVSYILRTNDTSYNWCDIYNDLPLNEIQINFVLSDNKGGYILLNLPPNEYLNVELVFARKFF